ncbi:ABC transporter ATP-binding protein [Candidatus Omnitrophota bacterium]
MTNLKEFLYLLKPYKRKISFAFIAILMANLLGLAFPWVIKIVIDDIVVKKDIYLLNIITIGLVLVFILKSYFGYMREYMASFVGEKVVYDLRRKIYAHLQRLSVKYIEDTSTGKMISGIIGDTDSIRQFLFGGAIDFIYSFLNIIFVLCILFALDWRLTLLSIVYLPIFGVTFFKLTPKLKERHMAVRERYAELTTRLNEVFRGIRVVAGFSREAHESDKFNFKQKEIFKLSMGSHSLEIMLWMFSEFISSLGLITLVWFGVNAVFSGRITTGTLMAFYSYLGMLFFPIIKMVIINSYYQEAAASMERIRGILVEEPQIKQSSRPVFLDTVKGNISFRNVSFSYDGGKEILSDVDFDVKGSEIVAIAGKSGAGKTTLINLLLRFYEPTKGAIFIDGHNLKDLELESYRSKIGIVLQDDYLFSGTIKENILYGKPDASMQDIIDVAKLAAAHEFIICLAGGYDSEIGERGIKLSYGQRQRISIARAILRDPDILILDEATSSVDSETERLIIERAFRNLMSGRTTFIISHRLAAIDYADKIMFVEDNKIRKTIKPAELLDKKENYQRI